MKLTPHPILLSLSIRLLQVTVAISPPAAKGASKGPVFWVHPIGRSPQANAGFRKLDERGASTANQKVFPTEKCRGLPGKFPFDSTLKSCICWEPSGLKKPENSEAPFRNPFQCGGMGGRGDFGMRLGKSRNQGHALGLEEGLSEAKPSCPLPIPAFSVFPDFVVFPASWSGDDASHTSALNTSSTHLLRGFRTFHRSCVLTHKSRFSPLVFIGFFDL